MSRHRAPGTAKVAAVLTVVVLVFGVTTVLARMTDDDIPGVVLPSSPVRDSLTETTAVGPGNVPLWDIDDVYQVRLAYNERFEAQLTPPAAADFDLYLIAPGTRRLADAFTAPYKPILRASEQPTGAVERINYVSDRSTTATFYLDVAQQYEGSGPYVLEWKRTQLPTPQIASEMSESVRFGTRAAVVGTATVTDQVTGGIRPMSGFFVEVKARPFGSSTWTRVATSTTAPDGTFTMRVRPVKRTEYRVYSRWSATADGDAVGYGVGPVMTVWPRAYLTIKAPVRAVAGKTFDVTGLIKPSHGRGTGHVRVLAYRKSGAEWRPHKAFAARNSSVAWRASVKLPKGVYQLRATVPTDTLHATTVSSPRTVTVR